ASIIDTVPLAAGDSIARDYTLAAAAVELQPTVVTVAKRSQLLDQAVTSVAVVSDTELARRAVNTVDEAVDKAPGVQFLNGQVNIRGSTGYVQGLGGSATTPGDGRALTSADRTARTSCAAASPPAGGIPTAIGNRTGRITGRRLRKACGCRAPPPASPLPAPGRATSTRCRSCGA